jgi:predicted deacetylase
MTAGEGEFLTLGESDMRARIARGMETFSGCLSEKPLGFVPPAWLHNEELFPILKEFGFRFTEDHGGVYEVQTGQRASCPVITWATRTRFRQYASRVVCPALLAHWRDRQVIRIALHPTDFDHPKTVDSIVAVLARARRDRRLALYEDALCPRGNGPLVSTKAAPSRSAEAE